MKHKIYWGKLLLNIAVPLAVGFLSALLTKNNMHLYDGLNRPPLSPPKELFPTVWTTLYILMGISSYRIMISRDTMSKGTLCMYGLQLAINFLWPLIFFNTTLYFLAFLILCILWILVFVMMVAFMQVDTIASWLQYPYMIWITFAAYLNLGIVVLNLT